MPSGVSTWFGTDAISSLFDARPLRRKRKSIGISERVTDLCPTATSGQELLPEDAFLAALALECRRANRSGKLCVLVQLDLQRLLQSRAAGEIVDPLKSAASVAMRATDFLGWYTAGVVGVVFTEVRHPEKSRTASLLHTRIVKALHGKFDFQSLSRIATAVHVLPESSAQGRDVEPFPGSSSACLDTSVAAAD